jgi:flagellar hook-associated protein 3 FlgL
MRITMGMMTDSVLANIQQNQDRMETLQSQITSGSRITKPSDDPIGAAHALSFQEGLDTTDQYLTNINEAQAWLNTTDDALNTVTQDIQRARELAVQAANDTSTASDRAAIQQEVNQLQAHALDLSQAKYGAYYIFSGTRSDQPGYVQANPSTVAGAYKGNTGQVQRQISTGVTMAVNVDAQPTFDPLFTALNQLQAGLTANSSSQIQTSISALDTALTAINSSRAQVGAKVNRLEALQNQLGSVKVNLAGLLSNVKDVDMAQAITSFSMAQTVLQASLKAGAQALQPSLLDYLH